MLRKFPYFSRFTSKLFYELLPAAIASAVGGMLFNHYAKAPVATPSTAVTAPANAELLQMVRDEHAVFVDYLKKNAETRQQAELAAEQDAKRLSAAEQSVREARAAEARALTLAARVTEKPEKKLTAKPPAPYPATEPVQLRQPAGVATQMRPATPPLVPTPPAAHNDENVVTATLHDVTATVGRIPSWVRSATDWFSDDTVPRPPAELSPRNFAKASM